MATCSTRTAAFIHHGIDDGVDLVARTYYELADDGHRNPEPTTEFAERVASAFRGAFVRNAPVPLVPDPVDAAIDEATDTLVHRVLDDPDADLRTEILPAFYRDVASAYCAHLDAGGDPGEVGVWYDEDEEDGGGGIRVERP